MEGNWGKQEVKNVHLRNLGDMGGGIVSLILLKGAARYAGLLLAPAEGFGLWPRLFLPFRQKKSLSYYFGPHFGSFW